VRSIGGALLAALVAGCSVLSAPAAVRATLREVEALGYHCDSGVADNVPSGLTQWKCLGTVDGVAAIVDVEGSDAGVVGLTLDVQSVDPDISRAEFRRIASRVPPLTDEPDLATGLDTWTGPQHPSRIGRVGVNGLCDATQCIVFVRFVEAPAQPSTVPSAG